MMTQEERRLYLIRALLAEEARYRETPIPRSAEGQKRLLRSLMNVRAPKPVSGAFLDVQDAYLTEEIKARGVVDSAALRPVSKDGRLFLWQGDITRLKIDAIVNAANSALIGCFRPCHACIDNIVHTMAGVQLRLRCSEIMREQGREEGTGGAKITPGYNLPCRCILHTVGPIISGPLCARDCAQLESCYEACLTLAAAQGLSSIAFCCISTGVFHFPQERAAEIAVRTVRRFLKGDTRIRQVVFDVFTDSDHAIYQKLLRQETLR